jgi:hypothetical protein
MNTSLLVEDVRSLKASGVPQEFLPGKNECVYGPVPCRSRNREIEGGALPTPPSVLGPRTTRDWSCSDLRGLIFIGITPDSSHVTPSRGLSSRAPAPDIEHTRGCLGGLGRAPSLRSTPSTSCRAECFPPPPTGRRICCPTCLWPFSLTQRRDEGQRTAPVCLGTRTGERSLPNLGRCHRPRRAAYKRVPRMTGRSDFRDYWTKPVAPRSRELN